MTSPINLLGSTSAERRAKFSEAFGLVSKVLRPDPKNVEGERAAVIVAAHDYLTLCVEVYLIELGRMGSDKREALSNLKMAIEALGITKSTKDEQELFWKSITALRAKAAAG